MRFIKLFEEYTKQEIKEQTDILYKDKNLIVLVVKTPVSSDIYGKNTNWCSVNDPGMFHEHNVCGNLFRILFKDGYKLRLTWDYMDEHHTHWGQGGKVNGVKLSYTYLRCKDPLNPFFMEYDKNDNRQELANRINSLPKDAIEAIKKYHRNISVDKDKIANSINHKIHNMKVLDFIEPEDGEYKYMCELLIGGEEFVIELYKSHDRFIAASNKGSDFRLKYPQILTRLHSRYFEETLKEKIFKYLEKNNRELLADLEEEFDTSDLE